MVAPQTFVALRDAQTAVRGREIEIVQAVGIAWASGRNANDHIDCPYPSHGTSGAGDWRFDAKRGKAVCSCTKWHSIFDVVSKVEGVDFEQSKIRCVEILGRKDLIRQGNERGQSTTAKALLSIPAERRDDSLPRTYFANRLTIEPANVLMPVTRCIGVAALPYFDASKSEGGKPRKVGDHPCAVFEQVNAAGEIHAHRIYLAAGGAGKAELGARHDGKERDPKKSAAKAGDESTAGRVVIWGDAARAPWCIIAEGIETAAAVAHAFRAEIEAGAAYVAAGISAGGIEAFKPWPATRRVTVAADRDEGVSFENLNPSRRGERAARTFGLRNADIVEVSIALPGAAGAKLDWLDIHGFGGPEAVRAGILGTVAFVATTEELDEEHRRTDGLDDLARIERDYPLTAFESFALTYRRTKTGRVKVHKWVKAGDEMVPHPIASPFGVVARLRYVDQADAYGLRIVVEDMGGKRREIDVERAAFARQGAADTRAMLFAAGLRPEDDGEIIAVKALKAADPRDEIAVVRRPGWHALEGVADRFFACPNGEIIGAAEGQALELSVASRISGAVAVGGTLEGWQTAVAAAASVTRCEHWTLGIAAAFAAPIVSLTGLDTCGFNLSGMTSGGKTTAQRLAVSAWSRAALDQRESLLQSARATANGVEGMAARASGTVLALDELGHVGGKELGKIIYSLASGVGKSRMTAEAQLRASHTWSTFIILSAEKSLEEKVRGDGGEWYGGMAARIPDVDITGVDRAVDQAVMAQIQAVDQNFGHAGPAFVRELVRRGWHASADAIRSKINEAADKLAGPGADAAMRRAALPFAIVLFAGRMAREFGIIPDGVRVETAVDWAWKRFGTSTDAAALDPEEQAVANIRTWIAERWDTEIHTTEPAPDDRRPTRNALAWHDDEVIYIPACRIVEVAGGTLKETEIGKALDAQKLIAKRKDQTRFYYGFVPKVGPLKVYALRRDAFRSNSREEPAFTVYEGGRR